MTFTIVAGKLLPVPECVLMEHSSPNPRDAQVQRAMDA